MAGAASDVGLHTFEIDIKNLGNPDPERLAERPFSFAAIPHSSHCSGGGLG
jgi:hypothetical protein